MILWLISYMGQYLSFATGLCNTLKNKAWSYWFLRSLTSKAPSLLHETILCCVLKRTEVMVLNFFERDVLLRNRTTGNSSSVLRPVAFWHDLWNVTGQYYLPRNCMCICRWLKGRSSSCTMETCEFLSWWKYVTWNTTSSVRCWVCETESVSMLRQERF